MQNIGCLLRYNEDCCIWFIVLCLFVYNINYNININD